jgi:hypothetical protein
MADLALRPLRAGAGRGALRAPWLAARAAAALSLFAGWVHLAFIESHWEQWWAYGAFFLVTGAVQSLFVPLVLRWPRPWVVWAGIAGNLAIVGMYVVSRTYGPPVGPHEDVAERATAIDLACTAAEVALIGALLVLLPRGQRRWVANALLAIGILLWVLRLTEQMP